MADDIYDGNDGGEMWTNNSGSLLSATTGKAVGSLPSSNNFLIWWDADEARELEDQTSITKYDGGTLLSCPSDYVLLEQLDQVHARAHRRPTGRLARRDHLARKGQLGPACLHNHGCDHAPNLHPDA